MSIGGEEDKDTGYKNVEEDVASSWKFCQNRSSSYFTSEEA